MNTEKSRSSVVVALLDRTISFLVETSLFIAIVGAIVLFFSFLLYAIPVDVRLLFASFLIVFSVYSIDKLDDMEEDAINVPDRARFATRHRHKIEAAVLIAVPAALLLAFSQSFYAMLVVSLPLVVGFLYSAGISAFRLKNVKHGEKSVVVATTWALVATLLPLVVVPRGVLEILLVFWFFFVKCFVNTTLFDFRDIDGDVATGVVTLPVYFGRSKTRSFLLFLNSSLVIWLGCSYLFGFFHKYLPLLVIFIAYGYWCILRECNASSADRYVDLPVDGEWLLLAAATIPFIYFL